MTLPINIIIGNLISLFAGILIIASLCINDDKKAYKYHLINALILIIASFFFNSLVGAVIMVIASVRILMVYKDRFTIKWAAFFLILSVGIGFAVNTLGWIGLIPIVAVTQITICNYAYKDIRWIKLSFIENESFYIFYFYLVFDIVSTIVQIITVIIGCISYIRLVKKRTSKMFQFLDSF